MILTVEHTCHRYAIPIYPCTKWNTAQDLESQADITNSDYGKSVKTPETDKKRTHACSPPCHETPRDAPSAPGRGVAIANRDPGKSVKNKIRTRNERMHAPINAARPHATRQAPPAEESRSRKITKKQEDIVISIVKEIFPQNWYF